MAGSKSRKASWINKRNNQPPSNSRERITESIRSLLDSSMQLLPRYIKAIVYSISQSAKFTVKLFYHEPQYWFIVGMKEVMGANHEVNTPKISQNFPR